VKFVSTVLLIAILTAACTGSVLTSKNDAPEVFRLQVAEFPPAGKAVNATLSIARPRAASSLDTSRIAVVKQKLGFDYYAGVRWADPSPQMLQQMLVQALSADGGFSTVVVAPSRVPADLLLEVELRRFEARARGEGAPPYVTVEMQAVLVDLRNGERLRSFPAYGQATASANRRTAVIAAFDEATNAAIATVVTGLRAGDSAEL
jgi:cholesterol transport system auxiliary component